MKLVVVSHTPHYSDNGLVKGWGPTVRELDHLASLCGRIVHVACLHSGPVPRGSLAYESDSIQFVPVPAAGGRGLVPKLKLLSRLPGYVKVLHREISNADVLHVRLPCHLGLVSLLMLVARRAPKVRWFKYAGDWNPTRLDPISFFLQRFLLKKGIAGGVVTVNGDWPDQPSHVRPFFNPCLTREELAVARAGALGKTLTSPMRLLFVGAIEETKGIDRAIHVVQRLRSQGLSLVFDVIGDGSMRAACEQLSRDSGLTEHVRFHGALPRPALTEWYAQAHVLLFPSATEGWPKVISEGMAHGVVPVAGITSCIPSNLKAWGLGRALPHDDVSAFADAILAYIHAEHLWKEESLRAVEVAECFTYENYLEAVRRILTPSDVSLTRQSPETVTGQTP